MASASSFRTPHPAWIQREATALKIDHAAGASAAEHVMKDNRMYKSYVWLTKLMLLFFSSHFPLLEHKFFEAEISGYLFCNLPSVVRPHYNSQTTTMNENNSYGK